MISLLLLKGDTGNVEQLKAFFSNAGYQVTHVTDIADRHLPSDRSVDLPSLPRDQGKRQICGTAVQQAHGFPLPYHSNASADPGSGITIFTTNGSEPQQADATGMPALQAFIVSLARRFTSGWRLSLRNRTLEAPNGVLTRLTSLEFSFIKIFALVDVGEAVSRKKIVQEFGEDYLSYDQNRLDTMVTRLRKKIEVEAKMAIPLHTVRVRGFAFDDVLILDM